MKPTAITNRISFQIDFSSFKLMGYPHPLRRRAIILLLLALIPLLGFNSCSPRREFDREGAHRRASASERTLEWLNSKFGLIQDKQVNATLVRIIRRLSAGIPSLPLDSRTENLSSLVWGIFVVDSPLPNAFALGSGKIVITKSLIAACDTEAELASVISHEMSHEILGHINEAIDHARETSPDSNSTPKTLFSLDDELDADRVGLTLLDRARYSRQLAAEALTIGFRRGDTSVAKSSINLRSARLSHLIRNMPTDSYLETRTTRDYRRMRRRLRKIRGFKPRRIR